MHHCRVTLSSLFGSAGALAHLWLSRSLFCGGEGPEAFREEFRKPANGKNFEEELRSQHDCACRSASRQLLSEASKSVRPSGKSRECRRLWELSRICSCKVDAGFQARAERLHQLPPPLALWLSVPAG